MAQRYASFRNASTKLNPIQIQILVDTYCRQKDAWRGPKELEEVLTKKGQSNYHIYKMLCEIKGYIIKEKGNSFCVELEKNIDFKLITDIVEKLFFKRLVQRVEKVDLRSEYSNACIIKFLVYK